MVPVPVVVFFRCPKVLWLFTEISGEQNGYNIPELSAAPEVEDLLSEAGARQLRLDPTRPLPPRAKRLVSDAYLCFYQSTDVRMYRWVGLSTNQKKDLPSFSQSEDRISHSRPMRGQPKPLPANERTGCPPPSQSETLFPLLIFCPKIVDEPAAGKGEQWIQTPHRLENCVLLNKKNGLQYWETV